MAPEELHVSNPAEAAEALATPPTQVSRLDGAAPHLDGASPRLGGAAPRLADGVELIGEFADSGFKRPPFIARRADGQVVQMPELLYRLAEQVDGETGVEEIADRFSHAVRRRVEAADVEMLIEEKLRPLGIVAPRDGADTIKLNKLDPLLALKLRTAVVPDGAVRSLTTLFRPLFLAPVVVIVVLGMLGLDGWLFFVHGISQSLRHVLYQPALMLILIGGVILSTAFHEIGHATACRYGGAKPGAMGVGIYIVWPAFYTDITDAYRLGKWGRVRTDVGGMYFNAIFAVLVAGIYAATSWAPLLLLILLQNFAILQQALPLLRLDGYYILSDLTGVPDIYLRIRSVLGSLVPGRPADDRVEELKSWVRVVVSAYVVLVLAALGVMVLALVINLPRLLATGYDSASLRFDAVGPALRHGHVLRGVLDVIQMLFLVLPGAGLAYTVVRILRRTSSRALRWSSGHPVRQGSLALAGAAAVTVAALSWWPNGEYRPIQPGERGTLTGLVGQVAALPTARPSLTVQRERELGGAPTVRKGRARAGARRSRKHGSGRDRLTTVTATSATAKTSTPTAPTGAITTSTGTSTTSTGTSTPSTTVTTTPTATTPTTATTTTTTTVQTGAPPMSSSTTATPTLTLTTSSP